MRVDHIADRLIGHAAEGGAQLAADQGAAQGIDHGNSIGAHDKARIGHVAPILRGLKLIPSLMHEHAGRNLAHLQRRARKCRGGDRDGPEQRRYRPRKRTTKEVLARDPMAVRAAIRLVRTHWLNWPLKPMAHRVSSLVRPQRPARRGNLSTGLHKEASAAFPQTYTMLAKR
jgi:hypothetical protein